MRRGRGAGAAAMLHQGGYYMDDKGEARSERRDCVIGD